ncbi:UNVERIFIED_CONTAM: hypothetical protein GTU68_048112 [Idotea baltica]|nr:hypothetical protein [Idotea baltica]
MERRWTGLHQTTAQVWPRGGEGRRGDQRLLRGPSARFESDACDVLC